MSYMVNEIFASYQGEGLNTGTPAVFIRLSGCNLNCRWCDTNHLRGTAMDLEQIRIIAIREASKHTHASGKHIMVVITGGEPTLQKVEELAMGLRDFFRTIALETNGTNDIRAIAGLNFISISPKPGVPFHEMSLINADEVKIVVGEDIAGTEELIFDVLNVSSIHVCTIPVWLQPKNNVKKELKKIYELIKIDPSRLRVGHQMHKTRGWL